MCKVHLDSQCSTDSRFHMVYLAVISYSITTYTFDYKIIISELNFREKGLYSPKYDETCNGNYYEY